MKATPEYIVDKLCHNGFDTYVVGGAVRDLLRGRTPKDVDIATSATPDKIREIFKDHIIKTVGVSFKLVFIDYIEVATFRSDEYFGLSDKNVKVREAKTIEEDLTRRDFTINAMALCQYTGDIIDNFGGKKDLKNKVIKFVGEPQNRIYEDPNRIIRACRFLSLIQGKFDKDTKQALRKFSYMVNEYVSKERIRGEILKSMTHDKPSLFFRSLHDIGALKYIFPSLDDCFGREHGPYHGEDIFTHNMLCGDFISKKYPLIRLAGYLHDVGKVVVAVQDIDTRQLHFHKHESAGSSLVQDELKKLKFSNSDISYLSGLVRLHMKKTETPKSIRRLLKALVDYNINYKDILRLKLSDKKANLKRGRMDLSEARNHVFNIRVELNREPPNAFRDLKVNGVDVMQITGLSPGKIIGDILKFLLQNVVDNPELNNREELKKLISNYTKEKL